MDADYLYSSQASSHNDDSSVVPIDKSLEIIVKELTCTICQNQFRDTMTLSCQHHFCHACVRQLKEAKCQICATPFWQRDAAPNHMQDRVVSSVKVVLRRYASRQVAEDGWQSPEWSSGSGTYVDSVVAAEGEHMFVKMIGNELNAYNPGLALYHKILKSRQEELLRRNKADAARLEARRREEEEAHQKAAEVRRMIEEGNKTALLMQQKRQQQRFADWSIGWAGGMLGEAGLESESEDDDDDSSTNPALSTSSSPPPLTVHHTHSLSGGHISQSWSSFLSLCIPEVMFLQDTYARTQPPSTYLYCEDAPAPPSFFTSCAAEFQTEATVVHKSQRWVKPADASLLIHRFVTKKVRMDLNTCYELSLTDKMPLLSPRSSFFLKLHIFHTDYYSQNSPHSKALKDFRRECHYMLKSIQTRLMDRNAVFVNNALYIPISLRTESSITQPRTQFPACKQCSRWCFAGMGDQLCLCGVSSRASPRRTLKEHAHPVFQEQNQHIIKQRAAAGQPTTSADLWNEGMKLLLSSALPHVVKGSTFKLPLAIIATFAAVAETSPLDAGMCSGNAFISPLQNTTSNIHAALLSPLQYREKALTERASRDTALQRSGMSITCDCNDQYSCLAHIQAHSQSLQNNPLYLHKMIREQSVKQRDHAGDTISVHIPGIKSYFDCQTGVVSTDGQSPEVREALFKLGSLLTHSKEEEDGENGSELLCVVFPDNYIEVPTSIASLRSVITAELALYQPTLPYFSTNTVVDTNMVTVDVPVQPCSFTNTDMTVYLYTPPPTGAYAYLALSSYHSLCSPMSLPGYTPQCAGMHCLPCPQSGHVCAYNYSWRTSLLAPGTPLMRFLQTPSTQKQESVPLPWDICKELPAPVFDVENSIPLQQRMPFPAALQGIIHSNVQYLFTLQHSLFTAPHKPQFQGSINDTATVEYNKVMQTIRVAQGSVVCCLDATRQIGSDSHACINQIALSPIVDVHVCASLGWQHKAEQRAFYALQGYSFEDNDFELPFAKNLESIHSTMSTMLSSFSLVRMMRQGYVPYDNKAFTTVRGTHIPGFNAADCISPNTMEILLPYRACQALHQFHRRAMQRRSSTQQLIQPLFSFGYLQQALQTKFLSNVVVFFYAAHRGAQDVGVDLLALLARQRGAEVFIQDAETSDEQFLLQAAETLKTAMAAERTVLGMDPGMSSASLALLYEPAAQPDRDIQTSGVLLPSPMLQMSNTSSVDYTTIQPIEVRLQVTRNPPKHVYTRIIPPKAVVFVAVTPFFSQRATSEEQEQFRLLCRNTILDDKYQQDSIRHGVLQPIEQYILQ